MADTTQTTTPTTTEPSANGEVKAPRPTAVYATAEEARQATPQRKGMRLYKVSCPGGEAKFTWAGGGWDALVNAARALGFTATPAAKAPTKDGVAAQLAQLSPEDRMALLAAYGPAKRK
jgi:hypothetical protein